MPRKSKTETLLEQAADAGSVPALIQLDRLRARRERARGGLNATQQRAADNQAKREATSVSRSTCIVGPEHREGYGVRLLAFLLGDERDPTEAAWLADAEEEYRAACDAFPWPEHDTYIKETT